MTTEAMAHIAIITAVGTQLCLLVGAIFAGLRSLRRIEKSVNGHD